jgi:hypothetical protein
MVQALINLASVSKVRIGKALSLQRFLADTRFHAAIVDHVL